MNRLVRAFALAALTFAPVAACGGDDDSTTPITTLPVDASAGSDATLPTDSGALTDSGAPTDSGGPVADGGTCTASDLDLTQAALTVATGTPNVSLSSPAPAAGFYNVTAIKKPDAAALGTKYRGLLAFTATSIFLTEQWDDGPVVKRKASFVVNNGAFDVTPLCGDFPGSRSWKFYYDESSVDAGGDGKKRIRMILPGLSSDKGYELSLVKTI